MTFFDLISVFSKCKKMFIRRKYLINKYCSPNPRHKTYVVLIAVQQKKFEEMFLVTYEYSLHGNEVNIPKH